MIKVFLLVLFLSCLVSCEKEEQEMAVFEVEINDSDLIEGDTVEIKMTRLGCSVDDLSVEPSSPVEWEIGYRKESE